MEKCPLCLPGFDDQRSLTSLSSDPGKANTLAESVFFSSVCYNRVKRHVGDHFGFLSTGLCCFGQQQVLGTAERFPRRHYHSMSNSF